MKLSLFATSMLLAGCAMDFTTARSISMKPGKGGIVTLNPPQDPRARSKAQDLMAQTCAGKKPEITEEGEVAVGVSKSSNTEHKAGNENRPSSIAGLSFGGSNPSSNTESTEKQLTEWRITYECR